MTNPNDIHRHETPHHETPHEAPARPQTTVINTDTGQRGAGWFMAGAVVVLLLLGGFLYFGATGEPDAPTQSAVTEDVAPAGEAGTDATTTGSTATGGDAGGTAPQAEQVAPPADGAAPADGGEATGAAEDAGQATAN